MLVVLTQCCHSWCFVYIAQDQQFICSNETLRSHFLFGLSSFMYSGGITVYTYAHNSQSTQWPVVRGVSACRNQSNVIEEATYLIEGSYHFFFTYHAS